MPTPHLVVNAGPNSIPLLNVAPDVASEALECAEGTPWGREATWDVGARLFVEVDWTRATDPQVRAVLAGALQSRQAGFVPADATLPGRERRTEAARLIVPVPGKVRAQALVGGRYTEWMLAPRSLRLRLALDAPPELMRQAFRDLAQQEIMAGFALLEDSVPFGPWQEALRRTLRPADLAGMLNYHGPRLRERAIRALGLLRPAAERTSGRGRGR